MKSEISRTCSAAAVGLAAMLVAQGTMAAVAYETVRLVSDVPGAAQFTDPDLRNAWGLAFSPQGAVWVAENQSSMLDPFRADGQPLGGAAFVPSPSKAGGRPTGLVFNDSDGFILSIGAVSLPARLLTATEEGTIVGFNPALDSGRGLIAVDRSATGAVYKGLALARGIYRPGGAAVTPARADLGVPLLFAANFHAGQIEVFDSLFDLIGQFTDPAIPDGFAPFNVVNVDNRLVVAYAKQKLPDKADDEPGPGNGFIVVFDTAGNVLLHFAAKERLSSPWGMALMPSTVGTAARELLVGNFGDGAINRFNLDTGAFLGPLLDAGGGQVTISGLWSLGFRGDSAGVFGFGLGAGAVPAGAAGTAVGVGRLRPERPGPAPGIARPIRDFGHEAVLFFTAGPNAESDGELGIIRIGR